MNRRSAQVKVWEDEEEGQMEKEKDEESLLPGGGPPPPPYLLLPLRRKKGNLSYDLVASTSRSSALPPQWSSC